ncbi:MAG: hypothetical protein D6681_18830 [Calditrichaeota bacterium]|nr:MAG: hypothetical protein D6681_18830 [Calditrichota bacterium]
MNRWSNFIAALVMGLILVVVSSGTGYGQTQKHVDNADWKTFNKNLIQALRSGNEGLQMSALQLIIEHAPRVDMEEPLYDVMRIYRNHSSVQMRRLAFVALTKIDNSQVRYFLKRQLRFESDPVIIKQLRHYVARQRQ